MPFQTTHEKFVSTCIGMALRQLIQQDITFGGGDAPTLAAGKPAFFFLATGRTQGPPAAYEDVTAGAALPGRASSTAPSGIATSLNTPTRRAATSAMTAALSCWQKWAKLQRHYHPQQRLGAGRCVAGGRIPYRLRPCPYAP
jgi:hypothetical protein